MKVSSVSSQSITQALRHSLLKMQAELISGQKEVQTGRVADLGLALGIRSGQAVSLSRDVSHLEVIVASNTVASARLSTTQDALSQLTDAGSTFLSALTAAVSGDADPGTTAQAARAMLQTMTGIVNASFNGEHIFAGVNTDIRPLADFTADPPQANRLAFHAAFEAEFGFSRDDPAAAGLGTEAVRAFVSGSVEEQFLGEGWRGTWSSATDHGITTRIAVGDTAETSVSANVAGIRKFAMAATIVADLFDTRLGEGALADVAATATRLVNEAMGDIAQTQARIGFTEQRLEKASERLTMQIDIFKGFLSDLEGVDPYEASTRVNALITQIETSYALTARIQQLSLTKLLP